MDALMSIQWVIGVSARILFRTTLRVYIDKTTENLPNISKQITDIVYAMEHRPQIIAIVHQEPLTQAMKHCKKIDS